MKEDSTRLDRLDHELVGLLDTIKQNVETITDDSTVTIDGRWIPNSRLAVMTAQRLLRVSEILAIFEAEDADNDQ